LPGTTRPSELSVLRDYGAKLWKAQDQITGNQESDGRECHHGIPIDLKRILSLQRLIGNSHSVVRRGHGLPLIDATHLDRRCDRLILIIVIKTIENFDCRALWHSRAAGIAARRTPTRLAFVISLQAPRERPLSSNSRLCRWLRLAVLLTLKIETMMYDSTNLKSDGGYSRLNSGRAVAIVERNLNYPEMYRVRLPSGYRVDMANLTRCRDAAVSLALATPNSHQRSRTPLQCVKGQHPHRLTLARR
jgi:hypothetical protein